MMAGFGSNTTSAISFALREYYRPLKPLGLFCAFLARKFFLDALDKAQW